MEVLVEAGLASSDSTSYRLTPAGQSLRVRGGAIGLKGLGLALIRAGLFHDQARKLLDLGKIDSEGSLAVGAVAAARRACPQLIGVLCYWPDMIMAGAAMRVPSHLVNELDAIWSLLPPPGALDAKSLSARKDVGNRGELYSYQFERMKAQSASDIVWVARDNENLGYDIEDRSGIPYRRIEVKASGSSVVRFFISENEWNRAHDDPEPYEIHFWGGIDLGVDPALEFRRLRAQNFPLIYEGLADHLRFGLLTATPKQWRVVLTQP